jgi:hypothetical protein
MKKLMICLLGLPLALSGCVTPEEQAALDTQACHSYGAPTGSNEYFQCRMIKDAQHQAQHERAVERFRQDMDGLANAIDGRS